MKEEQKSQADKITREFIIKALCICPWCGGDLAYERGDLYQCLDDEEHRFVIEVLD